MRRAAMIATCVLATLAGDVRGEPFLVVPTLGISEGRRARSVEPGHELLTHPDQPLRWAVSGSSGDAAFGVSSVAIAVAMSPIDGSDLQLTASRWGLSFYRERRIAVAIRLRSEISVSPLFEARDVSVGAERRAAWGIGARFAVHRGRWRQSVTWTPSARGGTRDLFDGALITSAAYTGVDGWMQAALAIGSRVGGRLGAGVPIGDWHTGASVEVATGALGMWVGRGSRRFSFSFEGAHTPHLGVSRGVTAWGAR